MIAFNDLPIDHTTGVFPIASSDPAYAMTRTAACHGTTSSVLWDGRMTRVFHYVATVEYPYVIGCFHGTPISSGHAPSPAPAGPPPPPGQ